LLARLAPGAITALPGTYHPVTPVRVVDTREPGAGGRLFPGFEVAAAVTGGGGVPASGVAAVALNVTVADAQGPGYLSMYSYDAPARPTVSTINFGSRETIANSAVVAVPYDGLVKLYASAGFPHVLIDVVGWYTDGSELHAAGGAYHPLTPARLVDTRETGATLGPRATLRLPVTTVAGGAPSGARAVVLNVTSVGATADTYLTVWPSNENLPLASALNPRPGRVTPNQVVTKVGTDGKVAIYNHTGSVDVVVDIAGWYDDGTISGGARFVPVDPSRQLDTRENGSGPALQAGEERQVAFASTGPIPAAAVAVAANVTADAATVGGYFTAWPAGTPRPATSIVNFGPIQPAGNGATLSLGAGASRFFNPFGQTHLIVDVAGYFVGDT